MSDTSEVKAAPAPTPVPAAVKHAVEQVEAVLERVPPPAREQALQLLVHHQTVEHRGPLPHPTILAGYAEIVPDLPERLSALVERQSAHRLLQEDRIVASKVRVAERGQILAFILVVGIIGAAVYLGINGHEVLGGTLATTTIGSVLAAFLFRRESSSKEVAVPPPPAPPPTKRKR